MTFAGLSLVYYVLLLQDKRGRGLRAAVEVLGEGREEPEETPGTPGGHEVMMAKTESKKPKNKRPIVTEADIMALQVVGNVKKGKCEVDRSHVNLDWVFNDTGTEQPATNESSFKTIMTLDTSYFCTCAETNTAPNSSFPLINSPRSALTIFRNGLCVKQLCKTPKQTIISAAALEGLTQAAITYRLTHLESRRKALLNHLQSQYIITKNLITREHLAYKVRSKSQTPMDLALFSATSGSVHNWGSGGSSGSSTKAVLRSQRLIKEKKLGIPTAPLVYNTELQYKLGQIKSKAWDAATKELNLKKKLVNRNAAFEEAACEKEKREAREKEQQHLARTEQTKLRVKQIAEKTRDHKKRIIFLREAEVEKLDTVERKLNLRETKLELRLAALRENRKEQMQLQKDYLERKRAQVKKYGEIIAKEQQTKALERQLKAEEVQQREADLKELQREKSSKERNKKLEERRERSRIQTAIMEGAFKKLVMMKAEKSERQIQRFKAKQQKTLQLKHELGVLKDSRSQHIRYQADLRHESWMGRTIERARVAAAEAEAVATARKTQQALHKEELLQRSADRRTEKDRLLVASTFKNIALLEKQQQKHEHIESQLQQKSAAALEARAQKSKIRLKREMVLREIEESDIRAKKDRAFKSHNMQREIEA